MPFLPFQWMHYLCKSPWSNSAPLGGVEAVEEVVKQVVLTTVQKVPKTVGKLLKVVGKRLVLVKEGLWESVLQTVRKVPQARG